MSNKKIIDIPKDELSLIRRVLHQNPELSGHEENTSQRIIEMGVKHQAHQIISGIGGNSVAVVYRGMEEKYTLMLRCDMDALPIVERNDFSHKSINHGVAHLCGHDGHSSILIGMMGVLQKNPPKHGKIVLFFQAAEETGEGATMAINDPKFTELSPDAVYALHNLPSFPLHSVVIKDDSFASASKGMIIRLEGKSSHAAEPEKGFNPAKAVAEIIQKALDLPETMKNLSGFNLITLIHVKVGERAFGTSASTALIMLTLRSMDNKDMDLLTKETESLVKLISQKNTLGCSIEYTEEFPATINHHSNNAIVAKAAEILKLEKVYPKTPFRWSEDFGHFTSRFPGALFGIGAGIQHPALHNPDYDFPDEIIETGIQIFNNIIAQHEEKYHV